MRKRGVLYLCWGEKNTALQRSIRSLLQHHPELPYHVERLPDDSTLLDKVAMFELSPFEETLFLDADTLVLGRLDFGFSMARAHGIACCICEMPWARRYGASELQGDTVEYNTGVVFFTRGLKNSRPNVFQLWAEYSKSTDSSITFHGPDNKLYRMPLNDQASFARAIEGSGTVPFVLPLNWNFRPSWHKSWWGPLKIWHDYGDPSPKVLQIVRQQNTPGAILDYHEL